MPAVRVARLALALPTAALLAAGIAGCGAAHNPGAYHQGYEAGRAARQQFTRQLQPSSYLPWLCAQAAYKDIQAMTDYRAEFWQNGFDTGCADEPS